MQGIIKLRWIVRPGWDGPEKVLQFFHGETWEDVPIIDTSCLALPAEKVSLVPDEMKGDVV